MTTITPTVNACVIAKPQHSTATAVANSTAADVEKPLTTFCREWDAKPG